MSVYIHENPNSETEMKTKVYGSRDMFKFHIHMRFQLKQQQLSSSDQAP